MAQCRKIRILVIGAVEEEDEAAVVAVAAADAASKGPTVTAEMDRPGMGCDGRMEMSGMSRHGEDAEEIGAEQAAEDLLIGRKLPTRNQAQKTAARIQSQDSYPAIFVGKLGVRTFPWPQIQASVRTDQFLPC